jgi:hypothetical protein
MSPTPAKKRPSSTWFFFLIVLLIVGYAGYDYWAEKRETERQVEASLILNWKADQVAALEWVAGPEKMKLKRTVDGWFFESPLQEKADSEGVATFVEGLVLEKSSNVVKESEAVDWKVFGLDEPKARIRVTNNSGEAREFSISGKKNFTGDTYFRSGSENRVLLVSSSWQQKAEKKVLDFRDRRWARIAPADIEKISVEKGKERFGLQKKENVWSVVSGESLKLDQNKVRKLLTDMSNNQVQDFSSRMESKPLLQIQLSLKEGKTWTGQFALNKDNKHVLRVVESSMTTEISSSQADEIYKLSVDSLRDRSEPFQVKAVDVKKIELTLEDKVWKLAMNKDKWTVEAGSSGMSIDADKIKTALAKFSALEVGEFLSQPVTPLPSGQQKIVLQDGAGQVLLSLELRGPFGRKQNGLEKSVFFAKSQLVSYPFTMDESQWTAMDWKAAVNPEAKPSASEADKSATEKKTEKE